MSTTLSALKYYKLKMPSGYRRVRFGELIPAQYKYISWNRIQDDSYNGQTRRGREHEIIYLKKKDQ